MRLPNSTWFAIQQIAIVGDPDYMGCVCGTFVALELKKRGKKARKKQQEKLDNVTKAGGLALCADPDNWELVSGLLTKLAQGEHK